MAQTSHLKAAQLTALDQNPPPYGDVQSAGLGAPARTVTVSGTVSTVSADNTASTYQLVRVPSFAIIKYVGFAAMAMGGGKFQLSVYYSSSLVDGTAPANQGLVVPTTGAAFFASDIDCTSAVQETDETFQNMATAGAYNPALINKRLWDALALTSDPGGFFDIVAVCHTTAVTTGAAMSLQVEYAE
jgi:hypothetical protein